MYENRDLKYTARTIAGILIAVLVGGLAGAIAMLLLAPRSGKDTRRQIRAKGIELHDRTDEILEETLAQVRTTANKVTREVRTYRQKQAAEQLDDAAEALQARKKVLAHS